MAICPAIKNFDIRDLYVTVYDLNDGGAVVLDSVLMTPQQLGTFCVKEGETGGGRIKWYVVRANDPSFTAEREQDVQEWTEVDVTSHFG